VPRAGREGQYPGALSRVDNRHEICSACGEDEAMGRGPVPVEVWPIDGTTLVVWVWPNAVQARERWPSEEHWAQTEVAMAALQAMAEEDGSYD
jgi:hypothetical protein